MLNGKKKVGFLPSKLWVLLTIYIFCFDENYHEFKASRNESLYHVIADTKAHLSDFKLGRKLFQFM